MTVALRVTLADVVFAHWPVDVDVVAARLPAGVHPDTYEGVAYVGLVGLRMCRLRPGRLPPIPYLTTFPQVNVRLYGVDDDARHGAVFCSLDSSRLLGLTGRVGGLHYEWSHVHERHEGATLGYEVVRRGYPATRGAVVVRAGPLLSDPTKLETFLTARSGLFVPLAGRTWYAPMTHRPWALHQAAEVEVDPGLVRAAGFDVDNPPTSLMWSPGVDAAFRAPLRVS